MNWTKFTSIGSAGLALTCLFISGCAETSSTSEKPTDQALARPQAEQKIHLLVAAVERQDLPVVVAIPATVSALPDQSIKISPATSGKIVAVKCVPGQKVLKGQVLAKLDCRQLKDQFEQASANVLASQANVAQIQTAVSLAQDNLDRMQKLFNEKIAAQKDYVTAESQVHTTQAQLNAAQAQLFATEEARKLAQTQLSFALVNSPLSGIVAKRFLNVGDTADTSTPIVQVVNLDKVIVNANFPADSPIQLKVGQTAKITSAAMPGEVIVGKVINISPTVDQQSNTISVQILCANSAHRLSEGQTVVASILAGTHKQVLTVPKSALVPDPANNDQSMVYTVSQGSIHRAKVAVGIVAGDKVEITHGLQSNQQIVLKGAYGLPDGTEIEADMEKQY
jgi:RND family efflux transporter MFP subunit